MRKTALLFNSRNNYQLFERIFFANTTQDFSNFYIFNIDLESNKEGQKELRSGVMEKYKIHDLGREKPDWLPEVSDSDRFSAAYCMFVCIQHIIDNNLDIDWLIWSSHDIELIGDEFLERFERFVAKNPSFKDHVGVIGFKDWGTNRPEEAVLGRGTLQPGMNSLEHPYQYSVLPDAYDKEEYFIVEAPQDNIAAFNVKLYKKLIKPEYRFILYNWMDDISAQFGLQNKASIVVPSLEVRDLYREKNKNGVTRSVKDSGKTYHYETYGEAQKHSVYWAEIYNYSRASARGLGNQTTEFQRQLDEGKYKNTMQEKLFSWHISDGPRTLVDMLPLSKLRVVELKNIAHRLGCPRIKRRNSGEKKATLIQLIEEKML